MIKKVLLIGLVATSYSMNSSAGCSVFNSARFSEEWADFTSPISSGTTNLSGTVCDVPINLGTRSDGSYGYSISGTNYTPTEIAQLLFDPTFTAQYDNTGSTGNTGNTHDYVASHGGALNPTTNSYQVSNAVHTHISSPIADTLKEKEDKDDEKKQSLGTMNFFMADFKYESIKGDGANTNIYGVTAGLTFDQSENLSFGIVIPYDYIDYTVVSAHRVGFIPYVKYSINFGKSALKLDNSIHANYIYTGIENVEDGLHTLGGGYSARLVYDNKGIFIPSMLVAIQYNEDISDNTTSIPGQTVLKLGAASGIRLGDNAIIQASVTWNKDLSDYGNSIDGPSYTDIGVEAAWKLSNDWQLKGGYKTMFGLGNIESHTIYFGSKANF